MTTVRRSLVVPGLTVADDTDHLAYQPRPSVTTFTSYAWTANTARTPVLSC